MIRYSLHCDNGHEFDSWFAGSDAYDRQAAAGMVECPLCGSLKVEKSLMAPSVATSRKKEARAAMQASRGAQEPAGVARGPQTGVQAGVRESVQAPVALLDEQHRKLRAAIAELNARIVEATVDVGDRFPEEARRIHDGEAPGRPIRGQATLRQVKELWDDGIPVAPVPMLPDDKN